jgi:RNA polymerase sigma-70 factor (ECF subfamily)
VAIALGSALSSGDQPMVVYDAGTTNPMLLNRLGDWSDREAWVDFVMRYDPLIRSASRQYRLDPESTEELCQIVWIDLARRMRTYRYDPGKTFRGWLRRLCQWRVIDLLRKKKASAVESLDGQPDWLLAEDACAGLEFEESAGPECTVLLRQAEAIQDAVRRRVSERTWQVFWDIAIEGRPVRETAAAAGISYYAAFAAEKRVGLMLREEGRRLLAWPDRTASP